MKGESNLIRAVLATFWSESSLTIHRLNHFPITINVMLAKESWEKSRGMGTLRQGNVVKAHTLLTFKAPELTLLYNQNPPLAKLKKPDRQSPRRSTKPHLFHSVPSWERSHSQGCFFLFPSFPGATGGCRQGGGHRPCDEWKGALCHAGNVGLSPHSEPSECPLWAGSCSARTKANLCSGTSWLPAAHLGTWMGHRKIPLHWTSKNTEFMARLTSLVRGWYISILWQFQLHYIPGVFDTAMGDCAYPF